MAEKPSFVHPTALVEDGAILGVGASVWHFCHVRKGANLGPGVSLGKDVYVDAGVRIGRGARIQNSVNIFAGVNISDWCFVGPGVVFTNDQAPRVGNKAWKIVDTNLERGASIGAGAVLRCGISVGAFAMVGAGAVVTKSVPAFHLALGVPADIRKKICACGQTILPLEAGFNELMRDCCSENMSEQTFAVAKEELSRLVENGH